MPHQPALAAALTTALLLTVACSHSPKERSSRNSDVEIDFSHSEPPGTYSFMAPVEEEDDGWFDSAPSSRQRAQPAKTAAASPERPGVQGENQGAAPPSRRDPRPAPPEDDDLPMGMVVIYDDSITDEDWADSGAYREQTPGPASRSPLARQPQRGRSAEATSEREPSWGAEAEESAPSSSQVVVRRSRTREAEDEDGLRRDRQGPSRADASQPAASRSSGRSRQAEADDPFARLRQDLQEAGIESEAEEEPRQKRRARPQSDSLWSRSQEDRLPTRPGDDEHMAVGREAGKKGIHILAGVGLLAARDPQGGYGANLAYGLSAGWTPSFARSLGLDLALWRAAANDGTEFVSTSTSYHHLSLRAMWQPALPYNLVVAAGGGFLLSQSIVGYHIGGESTETAFAFSHRAGVEAMLAGGVRFKLVEFRLEMRALLRGGMRLDYLPTANLGVAF